MSFLASIFQTLDTVPQRHQRSICYADGRSSLTFPLRQELSGCWEGRAEPAGSPAAEPAQRQTASPTSQTPLPLHFSLLKQLKDNAKVNVDTKSALGTVPRISHQWWAKTNQVFFTEHAHLTQALGWTQSRQSR